MGLKNNSVKNRRTSGGQAGVRGYLVQTIIALLDVLLDDSPFIRISLEPNHASEQFDLLWEDEKGLHAVQIKSTQGQFKIRDIEKWASTLENSGSADEYLLCLVGLYPPSIAKKQNIGCVRLNLKNLDISAFREQAAHRLDRFLRGQVIEPNSAEYREMLADALIARLAAYSTTGKELTYAEIVNLLKSWVTQAPQPSLETTLTRLANAAREELNQQFLQPYISLKYADKYYVPRELESDIEKWLATTTSAQPCCFLILASAGCGKTNLLCRLASTSASRRPTFLLVGAQLRLDDELGLWSSLFSAVSDITKIERRRSCITATIANLAQATPEGIAVVIDAINEFHDPAKLRRELEVFLSETRTARVSVIISCRDYYWGLFDAPWWDDFLKYSEKDNSRKNNKRLLGNFNYEESVNAFSKYFHEYDISVQPEGNAREQLRHPLLLRFFCETHRGKQIGILRNVRLKDLFDRYWDTKLYSIAERMLNQVGLGILSEISQYVGSCILGIASHMLQQNTRAISASKAIDLTHSSNAMSQLSAPYGRILDEHIILEELSALKAGDEKLVAFVFEEFMEYAMAKALLAEWQTLQPSEIGERVVSLTTKYADFSQVFGVILYAALMLKEVRSIALWPVLIGLGPTWENVVIEAFRKLPADQIDDGVFQALIDLLAVPHKEVQAEALELLKFGRFKRIPTPELIEAVGRLVTDDDLRIRRRAILALASCPPSFAIPLIERTVTTRMHRVADQYVVVSHAMKALAKFQTIEAMIIIARACHGYWHGEHRAKAVIDLLGRQGNRLVELFDHDDFLVRIGAITMIGFSRLHEAIPALEALVISPSKQTKVLSRSQCPVWLDNSSFRFIQSDLKYATEKDLCLEQYLAKKALLELRTAIADDDGKQRWHTRIEKALKEAKPDSLHPSIEAIINESYCDEKLIAKIIKAGLENRSDKKWGGSR